MFSQVLGTDLFSRSRKINILHVLLKILHISDMNLTKKENMLQKPEQLLNDYLTTLEQTRILLFISHMSSTGEPRSSIRYNYAKGKERSSDTG